MAFAVTVSGEYKALFAFANQPTLIIILSLCYPPHSNPDYLIIIAWLSVIMMVIIIIIMIFFSEPQPRVHESGGKYGNGIIAQRYTMGQKYEIFIMLLLFIILLLLGTPWGRQSTLR